VKNIPNIITLTNLTCGLLSIIYAFQGNLKLASFCIFAGAFFDFFDGLLARLLKANSVLGKQLDSIADMVTFGVAPGMILFHFMYYINHNIFFRNVTNENILFTELIALLIPILSAYRLARFNIDTKQTSSFVGLPTPALAISVAAFPLIDFNIFPIFTNPQFLIIISIILPLLLIVKIPLFSLKYDKYDKLNNSLNIFRLVLIVSAVVLFFVFQFAAIPFIVILYLILSIINNLI
tara:strand:+ start:391 stop:1098 length:708 start_codon:yes stop_codon:yes gene_type:complete